MTTTNKDWLDEQMECAIRERGVIEHFRELESKPSIAAAFRRFMRPAIVGFALACAAVCAYIPYYGHLANTGYEFSMQQKYDVLLYRGDDPLQDKLNEVIILVNDRKSAEALTKLNSLEKDCEAASTKLGDNDEYVLEKAHVESIKEDISWYRAMSYMQQKKVLKAKSELRRIANDSSNSHSAEAGRILKKVY